MLSANHLRAIRQTKGEIVLGGARYGGFHAEQSQNRRDKEIGLDWILKSFDHQGSPRGG